MRKIKYSVLLFIIIFYCTCYGQIVYVDSSAKAGTNNGHSWPNAYTDLQSALSTAVTGNQIWVAKGTYYPGTSRSDRFELVDGVSLFGGFK